MNLVIFPVPGTKLKFSDFEVIALSMTSEALFIGSENLLFSKLQTNYKSEFPNLLSMRQYNERRKKFFNLHKKIRFELADYTLFSR